MTAGSLFKTCCEKLSLFEILPNIFKKALISSIREEYVVQKIDDCGTKVYHYISKEESEEGIIDCDDNKDNLSKDQNSEEDYLKLD
jgi:hypothetical protein